MSKKVNSNMNPFEVTIVNPETKVSKTLKVVEWTPISGRGKDTTKLVPEGFDKWSIQDFANIWGETPVKKMFIRTFKQFLSNLTSEATLKEVKKDDGSSEYVPEESEEKVKKDYSEMIEGLSLRGATMGDVKDRILEIEGDGSDANPGELYVAIEAGDQVECKKLMQEVKLLKKDLSQMKSERKRTPAVSVAVAA